ncbi:MAG: hypothetical protein ACYSUX_14285 [Planctomycetota bacterium]|jgi:hypothetical protein
MFGFKKREGVIRIVDHTAEVEKKQRAKTGRPSLNHRYNYITGEWHILREQYGGNCIDDALNRMTDEQIMQYLPQHEKCIKFWKKSRKTMGKVEAYETFWRDIANWRNPNQSYPHNMI